jgi:diaminopimelate decarboxylase
LEEDVRFIVLDGIHELATIAQEAERAQKEAHLLVRVNPDYEQAEAPASLNFASRVTAPFGLDLQGDELERALDYVRNHPWLRFHGFHMHLGSGLRETRHYQAALGVVGQLRERAMSLEMPIRVLDVGGGFHSRNQRMMNGDERSRYATHDELPESIITSNDASLEDFATTISSCVLRYFEKDELPELVYEPGRSIVGPCQHLLLTVNGVKSRPGCRPWVTTDGGIYTTTAPTLWVLHEVLLCNDANRPLAEPVNLTGSLCATGDIIYRNKPMPRLEPGETIAIMDVGAYFLQFECNFGFPRPAVVGVRRGQPHLLRDRESYDDMVARDRLRPRD